MNGKCLLHFSCCVIGALFSWSTLADTLTKATPLIPAAQSPKLNCGTFWTGWTDSVNDAINPCPANCERGEVLAVREAKNGDTTDYDVQFQCYQKLELKEARVKWPRSPVATLVPEQGEWGTYVRVSGDGVGSAASVTARWHLNDDDSQDPLLQQSVTMTRRDGNDAIEIQIPRDPATTGWPDTISGGTLRVYLYFDGQEEPVLAGSFQILQSGVATPAPEAKTLDLVPGTFTAASAVPGLPLVSRPDGLDEPIDASRTLSEAGDLLPLNLSGESNGIGMTRISWAAPKAIQQPGNSQTLHRSGAGADSYSTGIPVNLVPAHRGGKRVTPSQCDGTLCYFEAWDGTAQAESTYDYLLTIRDAKGPTQTLLTYTTPSPPNPEQIFVEEVSRFPNAGYSVRLSWSGLKDVRYFNWLASHVPDLQRVDARRPPGASRYWASTDGFVDYANLAPGSYSFRLGSVYEVDGREMQSDVSRWTSLDLQVGPAYALQILGFQVLQQTFDDPLQLDGKGDEVALRWRVYKRDLESKWGSFLGKVHEGGSPPLGDTNFQPHMTRAGSASAAGGIVTGDYVGVSTDGSGNLTPGFPLQILTSEYARVGARIHTSTHYVELSLWELDETTRASTPRMVDLKPLLESGDALRRVSLGSSTAPVYEVGSDFCMRKDAGTGNRPMGVHNRNGQLGLPCYVLKLDPEWIRTELTRSGGQLAPGVFTLDLHDAESGHYLIYLKAVAL